MYKKDFKDIVLKDYYIDASLSNSEKYHNIKKWLRYNLFPCNDADLILKNSEFLKKLNWPYEEKRIYIDCIFSMKTYFNMFLRMYNIKAAQSYAGLLVYFDNIFSSGNISKFCQENSINESVFYNCLTQQEELAKNTHTLGNYMTCPDNTYNALKGFYGSALFNDRIELVLKAFTDKENDKIQFLGKDKYNCWMNWFNQNIANLNLQTLFIDDIFGNLENSKIKQEFLNFPLHNIKIKNNYRFVPSEIEAYTTYLCNINNWIKKRTSTLNTLIQQQAHP